MKQLRTTCDHCGKEMNSMNDYEDVEFDTFNEWFSTDLCLDCYREISHIIKQFCKRITEATDNEHK